ncbi:MAG: tRNA 2-thiocytidine biosynthesis TtcA family protein [Clostridium sp.]|nr:tRNA 2-thiocytidine biosynthesis TtcA family protein [Clostridium sp.]
MKPTPEQELQHRIWRHFNQGITRFGLLEDNDCILIGLSGGKDSLALLEFMSRRAAIYKPHIQLEAVHVRMSNIAYQTDLTYIENFAFDHGVRLTVRETSFDPSTDHRKSPCFLCSWNRRKMLFETAKELGCNKIALGHHQDDILNTTLLNLTFQGQFSTMPALLKMKKFPMTIIRPLCKVAETDIARWAELQHYQKQIKLCPYETDSHRTNANELFRQIHEMAPEARHSWWNALENEGKLIEE